MPRHCRPILSGVNYRVPRGDKEWRSCSFEGRRSPLFACNGRCAVVYMAWMGRYLKSAVARVLLPFFVFFCDKERFMGKSRAMIRYAMVL